MRRFLKNGCNNTKYCDFEQQYHNIFVTISKIGRKSRKIFRLAALGVVFAYFLPFFPRIFVTISKIWSKWLQQYEVLKKYATLDSKKFPAPCSHMQVLFLVLVASKPTFRQVALQSPHKLHPDTPHILQIGKSSWLDSISSLSPSQRSSNTSI